ncbi:hypothetical protein [Methylocystis sp. ATCC 49242]|uniref:hypothetical protein n=1 Tax=Methylocystis sp. ATCC 49242 TaxID=622637 RepID=UPI0001F86CD7|nr:hypothetical protein [Methylocystis sp. ATCC 49242]
MLTTTGRIDRSAIMKDAHKRFRDGRRLGLDWTFGQCLRTAWAAAKMRRAGAAQEMKNLPDFSGRLSVNPGDIREGLGCGDRIYSTELSHILPERAMSAPFIF